MDMPPWHLGHVVRKLMLAHRPNELTRGQLAEAAKCAPMTITHLLKSGRSDNETIERVAAVFGLSAFDLRADLDRANGGTLKLVTMQGLEQRRRLADRDTDEIEAEQWVRRIQRLTASAQSALYSVVRAFEEASGLLKRTQDR